MFRRVLKKLAFWRYRKPKATAPSLYGYDVASARLLFQTPDFVRTLDTVISFVSHYGFEFPTFPESKDQEFLSELSCGIKVEYLHTKNFYSAMRKASENMFYKTPDMTTYTEFLKEKGLY